MAGAAQQALPLPRPVFFLDLDQRLQFAQMVCIAQRVQHASHRVVRFPVVMHDSAGHVRQQTAALSGDAVECEPDGRGDMQPLRLAVDPEAGRKSMALLGLVYRNQLFPRDAYRQTFDRLLERVPEKSACRQMANLLALAHERGCETELAALLATDLAAGQLPDLVLLSRKIEFLPNRRYPVNNEDSCPS
jgi:hypothetical protein